MALLLGEILEEDKIKEKIELAEKAVANIKDEALRVKAFEVVLNNLMSAKEPTQIRHKATTRLQEIVEKVPAQFNPQNLSTAIGIEFDGLKSVIDFTDDSFRIIGDIEGASEGDKQRNASVVILTVRYYCIDDREISSGDLRSMLQDLGIGSLVNMATNLNLVKNFIIKIGQPGSTSTKYRITDPGIREGLRLIRQMVTISGGSEGSTENSAR